jgi:hypothetical protein
MQFNEEVFTRAFTAALKQATQNPAYKQTSTATGSTMNLIHGPGSLFGQVAVGIEPDVISAMLMWQGIADHLPIRGVRTREVLLPFITGVDRTSSTEPTNECADCIAGETESCIQHFPMGRVCRETQTMTPDRIIERLNRGDIDLTLLNNVMGSNSPWHPGDSFSAMSGTQIMQIATAWALLFELPPLFMDALAGVTFTGNPVNNQGNGYREFRGANLLINTGFRDAFTNVLCPALDSDVKNFNHANVVTATAPTLYEMLEMVEYYVHHNARRQALTPANWAVVMRPELWQVFSGLVPLQAIEAALLTSTIPVRYAINVDGATVVSERDRFRSGMIIPLNGRNYPVVLDDGIDELNNANNANYNPGEFGSDIYFWPLTYLGNRPATWIDYKDFRFISPEVQVTDGLIGDFYKPSPDGRFAYTWVKDGWCFKIQAKIEPRLILRVPQLAGRIQNVKYIPMQHLRSPDPDSPYFFKGGVSTRAPTTYYY